MLYRGDTPAIAGVLIVALVATIGFAIAVSAPLVTVIAKGQRLSITLLEAALVPASRGLAIGTLVVAITLVVVPMLELGLLLWVLVPLAAGQRPPGFVHAMRIVHQLRPWRMIEVFLLGIAIAIVKLGSMATVIPGWGIYGIAVMTLSLSAIGSLDRDALWHRYEAVS